MSVLNYIYLPLASAYKLKVHSVMQVDLMFVG